MNSYQMAREHPHPQFQVDFGKIRFKHNVRVVCVFKYLLKGGGVCVCFMEPGCKGLQLESTSVLWMTHQCLIRIRKCFCLHGAHHRPSAYNKPAPPRIRDLPGVYLCLALVLHFRCFANNKTD